MLLGSWMIITSVTRGSVSAAEGSVTVAGGLVVVGGKFVEAKNLAIGGRVVPRKVVRLAAR